MRVATSHGSSTVWCLSGTPSTLARRLLHGAIPMQPLPVRVRISPTGSPWDDVVHFQPVATLQIIAAVAAFPRLPRQHRGPARGDARRLPLPRAPVHVIASVGAPSRLPLDVAANRSLRVERSTRPTASRRAVNPLAGLPPILLIGPCTRLVRMAKPAPRPPWVAQLFVHFRDRLSPTDRRAVGAPAPHDRIEGCHQPSLPSPPLSPDHCCDRSCGLCHCLAAGGDAGRIPARGRRGVWPDVQPQPVNPGDPRFDVPCGCNPGLARL